MQALHTQAIELAQELDVAVFPLRGDKRPLVKGWRQLATKDPEEIKKLFSAPGAELIGVPCGPDQDLICFDLDFGHDPSPEELDGLQSWVARHSEVIDRGSRLHRTRSGGLHILMAWPHGKQVPRRMGPKFEVIRTGFYFAAGPGYEVLQSPPMEEPTQEMLVPYGKGEAQDGGALMSAELADETMRDDGRAASRHDALLRMTQDWAADHPGASLEELCEGFARWFEDMYSGLIDPARMEQLLEWRVEGTEGEGELGRAMAGVRTTPAAAGAMLVAARAAAGDRVTGLGLRSRAAPEAPLKSSGPPPITLQLLDQYDPAEVGELQPWLVEGLIRRKGNLGITGMSGVGKSTVAAAWIAGMLAGDGPAVGLPEIDVINVAWLNAEEEAADLMRHVQVAQQQLGLPSRGRLVVAGEETLDRVEHGLSLVVMQGREAVINEPLVDKLAEEIAAAGIDVLMADPITEFNDADENNRGHAKLLNRAFRMIAQRSGVAVVYWAHTGKPGASDGPGWYRDDIYSQRGSSQNVGSLKTAATHWHMVPSGLKAREQWEWVRRAKNGETPNLTALTVVKVKNHARFWRMAYELRPSSADRDIAVAHPRPFEEAELMLQEALGQDTGIGMVQLAEVLVQRLGAGSHKRPQVNKQMEGERGWPGDLRSDRPGGRAFLKVWSGGVRCTVGASSYSVKLEPSNGAAFTCVIREL